MNLQLTKKQHIHAKCCIKKFATNGRGVEVRFITNQPTKKYYQPKNDIFTGFWLWGQQTESSDQRIEKAFHHEIENVGLGKPRIHQVISDYHLLWWSRHYYRHNPNQDQIISSSSNYVLSKKDEVVLENKGYTFVNDGVMPARFLTSAMLWGFRRLRKDYYKGLDWSLIESQDGEFIVADCYQDVLFMPISPTKAFIAHHPEGIITKEDVTQLNRLSVSVSTQYYFASDFSRCPM